ncbi:hypothetical protein RP20_CCG009670 [Aedes albopictus]|nr:hypothetical protein RP20_CCG009670 [Aedes albopictus]
MKNHRNHSSNSNSSSVISGRPKLPKPSSASIIDSNNNTHNDLPTLRDLPTVEEPEESVRDLVSRLESNNTLNSRNKPRIIESKCIEKMEETKSEPTITINSQAIEVPPAKPSQQPVDEPSTVTVNNHITVPNQLIIPPLLKDQKAPSKPQPNQSTTDRPKVCRNKNVDLAFAATITKASNKPAKEKENLARKSSLVTSSSIDTLDSLETIPPSNAPKMVTFKDNDDDDDENNNRGGEVEEQENLKPSVIAEQRKVDELTSPKLVNWSSLGKFDERQYFANDKKLIEKRKYDEMEFEEFEVLDSTGGTVGKSKEKEKERERELQQEQLDQEHQSECFDSLNSGK